jgi:hypothetical protein
MNAIDSVIVVPSSVFCSPAGLSARASPSLADATAAPARDVEIAPEPGRYIPPAIACPVNAPIDTAATHLRIAGDVTHVGDHTAITPPSIAQLAPNLAQFANGRLRTGAWDRGVIPHLVVPTSRRDVISHDVIVAPTLLNAGA